MVKVYVLYIREISKRRWNEIMRSNEFWKAEAEALEKIKPYNSITGQYQAKIVEEWRSP